jgi:hypothetical protein
MRSIVRWTHLVFCIPILGYIYKPAAEVQQYAPAVRYVFIPLMALSGLWIWKGHLVLRFFAKLRPRAEKRAEA